MDKKKVVLSVVSNLTCVLADLATETDDIPYLPELIDSRTVSACILATEMCANSSADTATVEAYVAETVPNYSPDDFSNHFRMSRGTFQVHEPMVPVKLLLSNFSINFCPSLAIKYS